MRAAFQMEMRLMRLALVLMCAQGAPALHTTLGSGALVPHDEPALVKVDVNISSTPAVADPPRLSEPFTQALSKVRAELTNVTRDVETVEASPAAGHEGAARAALLRSKMHSALAAIEAGITSLQRVRAGVERSPQIKADVKHQAPRGPSLPVPHPDHCPGWAPPPIPPLSRAPPITAAVEPRQDDRGRAAAPRERPRAVGSGGAHEGARAALLRAAIPRLLAGAHQEIAHLEMSRVGRGGCAAILRCARRPRIHRIIELAVADLQLSRLLLRRRVSSDFTASV